MFFFFLIGVLGIIRAAPMSAGRMLVRFLAFDANNDVIGFA